MQTSLPGGIEAWSDALFVVLRRVSPAPTPVSDRMPGSAVPLEIPGTVTWGGGCVVATLDPGAPRDETVDLDTLVPPLLVRGRPTAIASSRSEWTGGALR